MTEEKKNCKVADKTEIMQIILKADEILQVKGYLFVNSNEKYHYDSMNSIQVAISQMIRK